MSDESVSTALRSKAQLVVIEAPAGCGKTHQGADYAHFLLEESPCRPLILTHTHAACSVFAERTSTSRSKVSIRTIDSLIAQVAAAYHRSLDLPPDPSAWARKCGADGHAQLATRVAALLDRHPMIAGAIANRHPVVICDEHQDSSGDQHAVVMQLLAEGARIRIFADTMQRIFPEKVSPDSYAPIDWADLNAKAHATEALDFPHRWSKGCTQLGNWTLKARQSLRDGKQVDLTAGLPPNVKVVFSENLAARHQHYQWEKQARDLIVRFQEAHASLMVLTRHNDTARSICALFGRQLPIWEGHTRYGLEALVGRIGEAEGDPSKLAAAIVAFMSDVGKGFSPSQFGDRFEREASERCSGKASGKSKKLQAMAQMLLDSPDHRGVARVLKQIDALSHADDQFHDIEIDCKREFWDGVRLGEFDTPDLALSELASRRSYARPKPPKRAITNIYKAKGLECDAVLLMPCDKNTFPDRHDARCLLYVALSRAMSHLMLVVSRDNPSPLLKIA